jgi:hypothetical protein
MKQGVSEIAQELPSFEHSSSNISIAVCLNVIQINDRRNNVTQDGSLPNHRSQLSTLPLWPGRNNFGHGLSTTQNANWLPGLVDFIKQGKASGLEFRNPDSPHVAILLTDSRRL